MPKEILKGQGQASRQTAPENPPEPEANWRHRKHRLMTSGASLAISAERCDGLHCMLTWTKEESITLRLTKSEKEDLEAAANLAGQSPGILAALYVKEGVKRSRFPAIEFRDGAPGRVACLTGTRWPVWMVVELVKDLDGDTAKAAQRLEKPEALVKMALSYAETYPEEIAASLALHEHRDFEDLKAISPTLEKL